MAAVPQAQGSPWFAGGSELRSMGQQNGGVVKQERAENASPSMKHHHITSYSSLPEVRPFDSDAQL